MDIQTVYIISAASAALLDQLIGYWRKARETGEAFRIDRALPAIGSAFANTVLAALASEPLAALASDLGLDIPSDGSAVMFAAVLGIFFGLGGKAWLRALQKKGASA